MRANLLVFCQDVEEPLVGTACEPTVGKNLTHTPREAIHHGRASRESREMQATAARERNESAARTLAIRTSALSWGGVCLRIDVLVHRLEETGQEPGVDGALTRAEDRGVIHHLFVAATHRESSLARPSVPASSGLTSAGLRSIIEQLSSENLPSSEVICPPVQPECL
jgi:hypothetical protein